MVEISAALVMKLRKMSGQGMMDCKNALKETSGDLDEAMSLLRKKGLATLAKRAGRQTSEGRVVCEKNEDGKTAVMAMLCCETDFVSKSDDFVGAAEMLGRCVLACREQVDSKSVLDATVDGRKFSEILTEVVSKTGEKTEVGDIAKYQLEGPGVIGTYVHFNNKLGSMVEIASNGDDTAGAMASMATDIAMHVTAINPVAVDGNSIDPEIIEKEKAIAAEQAKNKPANIIERIVEGKLKKFFKDNCLVDQAFVKDDSKTVGEALAEAAKEAGCEAKIKRFIRFEIG